MADSPCHLCADKCRGHSLGSPEEWAPEPGSAAALEIEIYNAWEAACEAHNRFVGCDTSSIFGAGYRAALKNHAAIPTLLEAAIAVSKAAVKRAAWGRDNVPAMREEQRALADLRAAITLATGKDA